MEKLFFDLTEHEFSKGRKVLLWIFFSIFLLAGLGIIYMNVGMKLESIHITFSIAPFGISLFVGIIAVMSSVKRTDLFFLVDEEGISYRFGLFRPRKHVFKWNEIREIHMPQREKKILLVFNNNETFIVNLNWIEKKRTVIARKHIYYGAKEKNINIIRVPSLPKNVKK